jgi:hypothetical protein
MGEWSANKSGDRARVVWERLLGLYGDSLLRKFGPEPPDEWTAALTQVNEHQLARGMRRLLFSGKPHAPSLPEFMRLCRNVGNDEFEEGESPVALPNPQGQGDKWDGAAGIHLLGYITRRSKEGIHYCCEDTRMGRRPAHHPSRETEELTAPLVRMKDAWARDCREKCDADGVIVEPSIETQKAWWNECMRLAEGLVAEVRASYAAKRAA